MSKPIPASHLVFVRAQAGRSAELGARLSCLLEPSRQAPGCLQFSVQQSLAEPQVWLVSGAWLNQAVMNAYFNTPPMQVFGELLEQRLVDSLDFQTFSGVSASRALEDFHLAQAACLQQLAS